MRLGIPSVPTRIAVAFTSLLLLTLFFESAQAIPVYKQGHADIGVGYDELSESFDLAYRFGVDARSHSDPGTDIANQIIPSTEVAVEVKDPALARPAGSQWDFLGAAAGQPVWYNPQSNDPQKPFLGFTTESLWPNSWSGPLTWSLTGIPVRPDGGEFSVWQVNSGVVVPLFATSDGISPDDDQLSLGGGAHEHYNWGFTKPGVYQVELTASGNGGSVSGSGLFTFYVSYVPEPASILLAISGLIGVVSLRRRQLRKPAMVTAALMMFTTASSANAVPFQTTGHTDIRFLYDAGTGTADIAYYLDEGSTVGGQELSSSNPMGGMPLVVGGQPKIAFQPSQLITFIPDPPIMIPEDYAPYLSFTGAGANEPLWNIPMSQETDRPWTGISTESVNSANFSNIRYQLTAFSGPGQMSVLYWGVFGEPNPEFITSDGLSSDDAIDVPAHTHAHYEWYFSAPGTYLFELTATGTLMGGGTVSVADTFTFQVTNVPEPGGLILVTIGSIGALGYCRTRRQ